MDPLAIVDAFCAAWVAHDLDATMALVTGGCVFESTEPGPDGTRYEGREATRAAWQPIFDDGDALFETEETVFDGGQVRAAVAPFLGGRSRSRRRRLSHS